MLLAVSPEMLFELLRLVGSTLTALRSGKTRSSLLAGATSASQLKRSDQLLVTPPPSQTRVAGARRVSRASREGRTRLIVRVFMTNSPAVRDRIPPPCPRPHGRAQGEGAPARRPSARAWPGR